MSFVTKDLDLVLFLNSRNRIKKNCHEAVRSYIEKRKDLYARRCNQEEAATHEELRYLFGVDTRRSWCDAFHRPLKLKRDLVKDLPWKLSPNRYDVPLEVYEKHKGAGGAHWPKLHTNKSLIEKPAERRVRYNIKPKTMNISWLFPGNARDRRPTSRCMVCNLSGCYRNPFEPGPTHYFPKHHMIDSLFLKSTKSATPNPHIFLRHSAVPEKTSSLIPRHISMDPTPGRYEIRYQFFCPCHPKMTFMPGLKLLIDRQKRNRFRQLPFERIKTRLYCDPEWRYVKGHGFRYLFKVPPRVKDSKPKAPAKASENLRLKLYHDQKYKDLISQPSRVPISNPSGKLVRLPIQIKYNILSKRVIRKQLRINKKIAFNSGQERWKDGYRLPLLTATQQQANRERLPMERQLRDRPVTRISQTQIRPKLHEIPDHMKPAYIPELRKRLFKFLPLPDAKVLVTEQDTRPEMINGKYQCEKFYAKTIVPENYFIEGVEQRRAEERHRAEMQAQADVVAAKKAKEEEEVSMKKEERISISEPKVRVTHPE